MHPNTSRYLKLTTAKAQLTQLQSQLQQFSCYVLKCKQQIRQVKSTPNAYPVRDEQRQRKRVAENTVTSLLSDRDKPAKRRGPLQIVLHNYIKSGVCDTCFNKFQIRQFYASTSKCAISLLVVSDRVKTLSTIISYDSFLLTFLTLHISRILIFNLDNIHT